MASSSSSSSWRNPSVANQAKHHLTPLPDDFEPTEEETALLQMYDTIKNFERQAARLKELKAREKLEAKEAEFKQSLAKKQKVGRRKHKPKIEVGVTKDDNDDSASEGGESDDGSEEEPDEEQTLEQRRAAKLEKLRDEIETKQQAMAEQETKEATMREQLLATNDDIDLGPTLKRKRLQERADTGDALLTSLMKTQTPPHDFSKSLGLSTIKGKILFPSMPDESRWTPPSAPQNPNDGAYLVELEKFDIGDASNGKGNNTVAIKFNAPGESRRFSVNIAGPDHNDFDSILFHFNPRQFERGGQLVINDKQTGIWGQAINLPLSQVPLIFGQTSITLQIQITGDGFDIFIEDKHCARLEHRKELPSKPCSLFLQFPSSDDYGSPENWIVYKTWWGNKPIMAKGDLSGVPGVNSFNAIHPRKLFVSGLSKIQTEAEVDVRRAELERAFRKYGGARGVTCIVPTNTTFAFVEMENERMADLAMAEMSAKYKINRARWSRHEALQEKRAAEEAAKQGKTNESSAW